jgi:hypothetical protein
LMFLRGLGFKILCYGGFERGAGQSMTVNNN